jgi:hypothetical protein
MKQQDLYKLLAFFLAFTMIFSIFAYIFINPGDDTAQQTEDQNLQDVYDPEFWTFDQPFDSISDALNITPVGVESASYVDLESMTPQMAQWARQDQFIGQLDSIYKSNTTKMYYANLLEGKNRSNMLLSTMFPERNDFEYMVLPNSYPPILKRLDMNGYYNVMGTPALLAPGDAIMGVLEITESLNKTNSSYDQYEMLLSKVPDAPFQSITSNVTFAKQFYMGIRLNNGSYERTTAYLDLNSSVMKKLDQLKTNSTQRGISQYDIKKSGNYTIVQISGQDLLAVLMEEAN